MAFIQMAWNAKVTLMNAVNVTSGTASDAVNLEASGYEGAAISVLADFPGGATDHLDVSIQGSLDGTNFDTVALAAVRLDKATDPGRVTFNIRNIPYFRVYAARSGSTDTIAVTVTYRPFRYRSIA